MTATNSNGSPVRLVPRPAPKGVTDPNAVLTEHQVHLILTGQLLPSPNAIHALARDWMRTYVASGPNREDL